MIIKVCGMCEPDNIRAAETLNIDYLGFIFYSLSPRFVKPDNKKLMETIRECKKSKVGVFVNADVDYILKKASDYKLDTIQLHGNESFAVCKQIKESGFNVIKAVSVNNNNINDFLSSFIRTSEINEAVDYFLFDTKSDNYGGTGKRFNWSCLAEYDIDVPFFLSGGLSLECKEDIASFAHRNFFGVDLNSRFEVYPGLKDIEKIKKFISFIKLSSNNEKVN